MIGKTISHYRILEKLGGGGMGVVYKAQDLKLDRFVALKFLPPHLTADEDLKIRFIHEAKAASSLDHNNICTIYDIEETEDSQLFISMAYYNGETLKKKIERKPLNIYDALDIAVQVAEGLEQAHKKDIIHRDIKPANIMITDDGVVKIVDFGLAKLSRYTKLTKDGASVGTIAYMSPEQTKGEEVDLRTDIWSLGVVFYEMITGELPYKGDYDQAVIYSIMNEEPVGLSQLNSDIPENLEIIVQKTLAKDPNKRYQTVHELLDDLIAIQDESNISKQPLIPARIFKQKKRILWIGGFLIICLSAMFILFYPSTSIPFTARDWILITDFENFTEEVIFNNSLNTALSISIDQSQYVNVLSRRRMYEALRRMQQPKQEKINEELGREIAIREGIDIYIVPGISKIGNQYALMSKIQETTTGNTLHSNIFYAEDHTEILEKMDDLSVNIRKSLGESRFKIQQQNKQLAEVTTSSLEALQQYSLAIEQHLLANFEQARLYYQNALEIDTNFVSAKASLGNILLEKFDKEKGRELLTEAVKSVDNLTDREKYGILALHAVNVENNLEKGIKFTKMRSELYPDDAVIHNNLGWYYQLSGRYEEAVTEYKEAIRINPHIMITYGGILWSYLVYIGDMDSAYVWAQKMLQVDQQNAWANFYLGSAYVGLDSLEKAVFALERAAELNPKLFISFYRLAGVHRLKENYKEALEVLDQILKTNPKETSANYAKGTIYEILGNHGLAEINFLKYFKTAEERYINNPDDADACISLAILYSHLRKKDLAWELSQRALTIDSTLYLRYAEFYAVENKKNEAMDQLKKLLKSGNRNLVWHRLNPELQSLHDDERFNKLLDQYFN